jgi:hypothetical protein
MALMSLYMMESIVSYLFDDGDGVKKNLDFITKYGNEFQGYFTMGFGQTWLSIFHYEKFLTTGRRIHKRIGRKCHRRVKYWAKTGTSMLRGPNCLLDGMAMLCVSKASCENLIEHFQNAASACALSHSSMFEGLAFERLAKELQSRDVVDTNRYLLYRNQAVNVYRKWEAYAIANYLETKEITEG